MPIDASIYGQIQQPPNVIDKFTRLQQLRGMQGQQQMQDLQTQQLQRQVDEQAAVKAAINNAPQGTSLESLLPDIMKASPSTGLQYQKSILENRKNQADVEHTQQQTQELLAKAQAAAVQNLIKDPSDAGVQRSGELFTQITGHPHDDMTAHLLQVPTEQRKDYAIQMMQSNPIGQAALKLIYPEQETTSTDLNTLATSKTKTPLMGVSANPPALKSQSLSGPNGQLSGGLEDAAYRYLQDGTLPPNMGRGTQGIATTMAILNRAHELSQENGMSGQDLRTSQIANKGSAASLATIQKREAQIGTNEKNFNYNADQVLQLSDKVDRSGVPVINRWMNAGKRSIAGDADLAAFDTAVKTTVNEFAQIVGGTTSGGSTEGEKAKAEALLNAQQTPQQVKSVVDQMRKETANRMQSFRAQKEELTNNMRGQKPNAPKSDTSGTTPKVSSDDDYAKLPPGTVFIDPEGKQRRKP